VSILPQQPGVVGGVKDGEVTFVGQVRLQDGERRGGGRGHRPTVVKEEVRDCDKC
jgi:hypothetical protein